MVTLYNIMIIIFNDGSYYVTSRTDRRSRSEIWSSRNDGDAPVYRHLKAFGEYGFEYHSPEHLQGLSKADAQKHKFNIIAGLESRYGAHRVLNVAGRNLKVA